MKLGVTDFDIASSGGSPQTGTVGNTSAPTAPVTEIKVHYFRPNNDYKSWHLWMWPADPPGLGGTHYEFNPAPEPFGRMAVAQVPGAEKRVGVIVYFKLGVGDIGQDDPRDIDNDRFIDVTAANGEVWLIEGDPTIFYSPRDAWESRWDAIDALGPAFGGVFLDETKVIHATYGINKKYKKRASVRTDRWALTGLAGEIPIESVSSRTKDDITTYTIRLKEEPHVTDTLTLSYTSHGGGVSKMVIPRRVLDDQRYYYDGTLGAEYQLTVTTFRLWAPTATRVVLVISENERGDMRESVRMTKQDERGTWLAKVDRNLKGWFYFFEVTCQGITRVAVDPYARNVSVDGRWAQIADLRPESDIHPDGWKKDRRIRLERREDAIIYEVHVRDFSIAENSGVKECWRGKYLAFTQKGTASPDGEKTGIDSLRELGITHVELLPIQTCATLDEVRAGRTDYAPDGDNSRYNWGYDARDYNVPNGAYATTPEGTGRIREVKQMVQALHGAGIGVILDVVFGHVYSMDRFDNIVPQYFFRTDPLGNYPDNWHMGNELAAERPMVCKFILDCVEYWMSEYHIDGFRFDQMYLLGRKTVLALRKQIRWIKPKDPNAIILGEAWGDEHSPLPRNEQFTIGRQKGTHVAVFNNAVLDALAGPAAMDPPLGYVDGAPDSWYPCVKADVTGGIYYDGSIHGMMQNPDETINYASCHDDYTLWDRLTQAGVELSREVLISMDLLAQTIVFTCQGIPFIQGGEEFLRTRGTSRNLFDHTYNAGDRVNMLDWSLKARNRNWRVFEYYRGLIVMRRLHPAFRMESPSAIVKHLEFLNDVPRPGIYFRLANVPDDPWEDIRVIFNPTKDDVSITRPSGSEWTIVAENGRFAKSVRPRFAGDKLTIKPYSATIMYCDKANAAVGLWEPWMRALRRPLPG